MTYRGWGGPVTEPEEVETCELCNGAGVDTSGSGMYPLEGCPECGGRGCVERWPTESDIAPQFRDLVPCPECEFWRTTERRCGDGECGR